MQDNILKDKVHEKKSLAGQGAEASGANYVSINDANPETAAGGADPEP